MKIGCCTGICSTTESKIGDEHARLFYELGYDYIELPLAQVMDLSDTDFSQMNNRIKDVGIPVDVFNVFFPASVRLTGENANLSIALDYIKRATDRAAEMGVKVIVFGSAGSRNIPEGFPYARAQEQLITLLNVMEPIVKPFGITIALEPLNSKECNFILSVDEAREVVEKANCESIRLLADYYHMREDDECFDSITRAGSTLHHLHIAAKEGRTFPKPDDGEDYAAFSSLLKAISYDARISVEAYSTDLRSDAAASLKLLRGLFN